jgi:hypothetical protein
VSELQTTAAHGANVRPALERLIDVVLYEPNRAPGSDVCSDVDRIATALHRAFELRCLGDLDEESEAALAEVERFATSAGLPPLPHCEGCDLKEPYWSDRLASKIIVSL